MLINEHRKKIEQFMSYILRHQPEEISLTLDKDGYVDVEKFITNAQAVEHIANIGFTKKTLEEVVQKSAKQRFAFNEDKTKIRANQGHSVKINITYKIFNPTSVAYHGTDAKNVKQILDKGLLKMNRHHVHLTLDKKIAIENGLRFSGAFVLFEVDTFAMQRDGIEMLISDNNIVLVDTVPAKYLKEIDRSEKLKFNN